MVIKKISFVLVATFVFAFGAGCKKSEPTSSAPPLSTEITARFRWLGIKRLAADTNAAGFMRIWNEPETGKLVGQTLEKLSVAPWRLNGDTNQISASNRQFALLLRPLLDDLVQEECYFEARGGTNESDEMVLAVRLDDAHAGLWETNIAAVLDVLSRTSEKATTSRRWKVRQNSDPKFMELARAEGWTLVGEGREQNALLKDVLMRIQRDHAPFAVTPTNYWITADLNLARLTAALSIDWKMLENLPKVSSLTVTGDGGNVLTRGELNFTAPIPAGFEEWNIPTNVIGGNLTGFTATRGLQSWIASMKFWKDSQAGLPPDQLFVWANGGFPMESFFATPLPTASNMVSRFSDFVIDKAGPWFRTNDWAKFSKSEKYIGLEWKGAPYVAPFLQSVEFTNGSFALGGCFHLEPVDSPFPPELLNELNTRTNLVCYDWEITGLRIYQWIYLSQFLRLIDHKAQLPADAAGMRWLRANTEQLGNSVTRLSRTGPQQLSFSRNSSIGFTAIELNLLVDWLESPDFPRGSYSLLTPASSTEGESTEPAKK